MIRIPLEIIKLEDSSYHLLVEVTINKATTGKMIVDTGASRTLIDKSFASDIDNNKEAVYSMGLGGKVEVAFTVLEHFALGAWHMEKLSLVTTDLSTVNKIYKDASQEPIVGLLGSDLLLENNAKIDYKNALLLLEL